jgi:DNA mismatch endonuclease (patch repair protein)
MSAQERTMLMARIRGRDTKPEITIRKALFAQGFRYRLHGSRLPGRPDLVFAGLRAVIFVHGCFWHGHGCHLFKLPSGNAEFWRAKIEGNRERDKRAQKALRTGGWRVLTVWECSLRGKSRLDLQAVVAECARWLRSNELEGQLAGGDCIPPVGGGTAG